MRSKPGIAVLTAVAGLVFTSAAVAAIADTGGSAQEIAPPPSVKFGALENNTRMLAFEERQCFRLQHALRVDITRIGTVDDPGELSPGVIPAGTRVSSQFVNIDPTGKTRVRLEGSITTNTRILGVIVNAGTLSASDFLGAPGTQYPTGHKGRQLEFHQPFDAVTLSHNRRTVTIVSQVSTVHSDSVRIITACPAHRPPSPPPAHKAHGCTPVFWKQSHHFDSWTQYVHSQRFEAVFGVDAFPGDPTLVEVLNMGGGGVNALGRQAVAALLNAANPHLDFPLTPAQVISLTAQAIHSGDAARIEALKDRFAHLNARTCPLR